MGGGVFARMDSLGARNLAHTLTFSIDMAAFSSMLTFMGIKTPAKRGHLPALRKWGPFFGMLLASLMILVDLVRHVVLDAGVVPPGVLNMFNSVGSLAPAGLVGTVCTWLGNILLVISLICYVLPSKEGDRRLQIPSFASSGRPSSLRGNVVPRSLPRCERLGGDGLRSESVCNVSLANRRRGLPSVAHDRQT